GLADVKEVGTYETREEAKAAYAEALAGELAAEESLLNAARELNDLKDVSAGAVRTAQEVKALLEKMNGGAIAELYALKERTGESGKSYVLLKRCAKLLKSEAIESEESLSALLAQEKESIVYKQVINDRKLRDVQ